MKKTLLITIDFPPQTGGVANYLANLSKNLPSEQLVVLANETAGEHHFDGHQKYKILRAKLYYRFFWPRWFKIYSLAKKIIAKNNIKRLLISHILPIGYLALLLKLPYWVILHGYDIRNTHKSVWKKYWAKKILNQAEKIIVNSENTKLEVLKYNIDANKIIIVYPCPNLGPEQLNEHEKQLITHELDLEHKKVLLTVGRLVPRKGIDQVITALPTVLNKIPNLIYLVVGNGPDLARLEKLAEQLEVRGNVIFLEDIPDINLPVYYNLADIFIMPARQIKEDVEGFGIVYLEAAAFAKPAIAGDSGGVREAVIDKQTGIIVDPNNNTAIVEAILTLFSDPNFMNKLGEQAKNRANTEFQWPVQIKKITNLL